MNDIAGHSGNLLVLPWGGLALGSIMKHQLLRIALAVILAGAITARADAVLGWNATKHSATE